MSAAKTYRKIIATKLSTNFREATTIAAVPFPPALPPTAVLVRNRFVGINASDINFTAGIYQPDVQPPFDCGFEAVGEVVATGAAVAAVRSGAAVVTQSYGAFAEYQVVPWRHCKLIPSLRREYLPLDLSATTASIALKEVLRPRRGERAVVTAASGGTGQFAVQLLQHVYGCPVVGICSSAEKAKFLSDELGCDGVVCSSDGGAKKEETAAARVAAGLRQHYPRGVNIAYESVGGALLDAVLQHLALRGRILSIGSISTYVNGSVEAAANTGERKPLPLQLLSKSATLHTFFLPHFVKYAPQHFKEICDLYERGALQCYIDPTELKGLEMVCDGIDLMYQRKNRGKVIVEL